MSQPHQEQPFGAALQGRVEKIKKRWGGEYR
jgi:hypothetical protein